MSSRSTDALPLPQSFYARRAERVARALLGRVLVSTVGETRTAGRIVETEAYVGPHDEASHAAERIGRTARNDAMYGTPGIAYVYRIYGIHWCLNVVTGEPDYPAAALIRAVEPVEGVEVMRRRRGEKRIDRELTSGPGRLAQAFGITGQEDGHPLDRPPLMIVQGEPVSDDAVAVGPRIGIIRAVEWPLRYFVRGNSFVSR